MQDMHVNARGMQAHNALAKNVHTCINSMFFA